MSDENVHKTFDKVIREKIADHKVPETEALWGAIATNMAQFDAERKRRRRLIYWWFASVSLVGIIVTISFYPFHSSNNEVVRTNACQIGKKLAANQHEYITSIEESRNYENTRGEVNHAQNSNPYQDKHQRNGNLNQTEVNQTIQKTVQNDTKLNLVSSTTKKNDKLNSVEELTTITKIDSSDDIAVNESVNLIRKNEQKEKSHSVDTNIAAKNNQDSLVLMSESNLVKDQLETIDTAQNQVDQAQQDSLIVDQIENTVIDTTAVSNPEKKKRLKYLELGASSLRTSAYYTNNNLATGQIEELELTDGFGLRAQFGIKFNKRIELFTGLNFEKTELEQKLRTEVDNFNFQTAFGEVHIEEGENQNEDNFFFVERYFYYVEMPFGVRYNFFARDKLSLNLKGEMRLNYLVNQSNRNESYITLANQPRLLPITFSCAVGLGAQYNLKRSFSIVSDIRYSLMLNSISSNKDVLIKPYSIGIGLGLKKYF